MNVIRSAIEAKTAFAAPGNLSAHDDDDHVDRAPTDGHGALLWNALLIWWLFAAAEGPKSFHTFESFIGSIPGKFVLFCYTWALIHHLLGGLRHFAWDIGLGFDLPTTNLMARSTLIGSVILTLLVWTVGLWMRVAL